MSYLLPRDVVNVRMAPPNYLQSKITNGIKADNLFILNLVSPVNPQNNTYTYTFKIYPLRFGSNGYDIFIDNFTTFNAKKGHTDANTMCFRIKFGGMIGVRSLSSGALYNGVVLIPNETTDDSNGDGAQTTVHKGRKMNYICTKSGSELNQIKTLTIKVSNLIGGDIFVNSTSRYTMGLLFIERNS